VPELCGAACEGAPEIACDRKEHQGVGFHRHKVSGKVWEAAPLPNQGPVGRSALAAVAARTERPVRAGDAASALRRP
jgi:hypothetical protein